MCWVIWKIWHIFFSIKTMFHLPSWRGIRKYVPQYQILSCYRSHLFGNFNEAVFLLMLCLSDTEKKVWLATALCTFAIVRWLEIYRQKPTYRFSRMGSEYCISLKILALINSICTDLYWLLIGARIDMVKHFLVLI